MDKLKLLRMIHLAILATPILIMVLANVLIKKSGVEEVINSDVISFALAFFGSLNAIAMPFALNAIYKMTSADLEVKEKEGRFFIVHIIKCALIESCAIFGLVCSFITKDATWVYAMAGLAVVVLVLIFPKKTS